MSKEELDRRGAELLAELSDDPDSDCWREFDALFYEVVWKYLRKSHDTLGVRVARYLGIEGALAPPVLPEEVDEVAHEATTLALGRVRKRAARFDPRRGTATGWVLGSAEYAYVEVAKTITTARRSEQLVFVDQASLLREADPGPTPEESVMRHLEDTDALEEASRHLTEAEFRAIRLVVTLGYSYREAALRIFGDGSHTKKVDGLLTRAKAKLVKAWEEGFRGRRSTESSNVSDPTDR